MANSGGIGDLLRAGYAIEFQIHGKAREKEKEKGSGKGRAMKSIKEVSDREYFGYSLSIICAIFVGVGYLESVGIIDMGPIPTYKIAGSMLVVGGVGFYALSLITLRTEKFNNEIERLESRIDFLEDTLDEHAEVIDDNRDKINRITDFMWGECGLPNESQEYTSGDPRAEKKEIS